MQVEFPDVDVDLDALILTDDTNLVPSGVTQPPSSPGTFWLEAEAFSYPSKSAIDVVTGEDPAEVSDGAYVKRNTLFSGSKALYFDSNLNGNRTVAGLGSLRFPLDFQVTGQHYAWVRVRTPYAGRDSIWLSTFTGNGADREDVPLHFETTGDEWEWHRLDDAALNFKNTNERHITLRPRVGGVHLDRVIVTTDASFTPVAPDDAPSAGDFEVFEAEDARPSRPFHARASIRQIKGADTLVNIKELDDPPAQGYKIQSFLIDESAQIDSSTGFYDITALGEMYASVTVRNPDPYDYEADTGSLNELEIDRSNGNLNLYAYDESLDNWSLSTGGGLRVIEREEHVSTDGLTRTVLNTIRPQGGQEVSQHAAIYRTYAFGERMIERVRHPVSISLEPNGTLTYGSEVDPIIEEWEYYEEGNGRAGRLNYRKDAAGSWTSYEYDDRGRTVKIVSQYLDSELDSESGNRVV